MNVEFTTRHMFPDQKVFHCKVRVYRTVDGKDQISKQEIVFQNGYFKTADPDTVRAVMASSNFKRGYVRLVTDESIVGEFLGGHQPAKITPKDVVKVSDDAVRKLGKHFGVKSDHIEIIRAQITNRYIDDYAEIIIGDDLGVKTPAHKKRELESKKPIRRHAPDPDKLQTAKRESVFNLADKDGNQKTVKSTVVDPDQTLQRTRSEDPNTATYEKPEKQSGKRKKS